MVRGQKAGAGGIRQQQKRKGGASKKMFHKKPKTDVPAAAAPAAGRFAAAKDPAVQHAAAARASPAGVPYRLGKGKEAEDHLIAANRQVIADLAKVAADTNEAASGEDSDEDASSVLESAEDRATRLARERTVAESIVSKPGWAPLAHRLNPQSKQFDAELKEEWDSSLSKAERQELNRIDSIEIAAARRLGHIAAPTKDKRLDMSVRELRAKVREKNIDEGKIDAALETKNPKKALLRLLDQA